MERTSAQTTSLCPAWQVFHKRKNEKRKPSILFRNPTDIKRRRFEKHYKSNLYPGNKEQNNTERYHTTSLSRSEKKERKEKGIEIKPVGTFEGVRDLANGNSSPIGIAHWDLGVVRHPLPAHVFEIHVVEVGLRLLYIRHLLRHKVLRLIEQLRHGYLHNLHGQKKKKNKFTVGETGMAENTR